MPETNVLDPGAQYQAAVDRFLEGNPAEALALLEPLAADEPEPHVLLALAKVFLELGQPEKAWPPLTRLLDTPTPLHEGFRAYVRLLDLVARLADQTTNPEAAGSPDLAATEVVLEEVLRANPSLEPAVRSLRRQVQAGRPPVLRL